MIIDEIKKNLHDAVQQIVKSAQGTGASDNPSLIAPAFSKKLTNMIQYMNPISQLLTASPFKAEGIPGSTKYVYPKLTSLRNPGSFGGEMSDGQIRASKFENEEVLIKAKKSRFRVWDLGKKASEDYVDLAIRQWSAEAEAISIDFALGILYDNPILGNPADRTIGAWEDSLDVSIQANRIDRSNSGNPMLPNKIDIFQDVNTRSKRNGGEGHRRVWVMSPEMVNYLSQFAFDQTTIMQPVGSSPSAGNMFETHIGVHPRTMLGLPIIETTLMGGGYSNPNVDTMGAVAASASASGGNLANGTIYFVVTKLIRCLGKIDSFVGETMASAPIIVNLNNGGTTQKATLSFSKDVDALWYYVYASTTGAAGSYKKVAVAPGHILNTSGDFLDFTSSVDVRTITADASGIPSQGVYGRMQEDTPPKAYQGVNPETVLLWDLDEDQGLGSYKYLDDSPNKDSGFATIKEITPRGDYQEILMVSYGAPVNRFDRTSAIIRNLRSQ
ncbi:hypothetical protein Lepto782_23480 (plasmid) [Leptospira interrogans serovar Canicola]|uniref:Capsid protein n=1 Tax=Leptospira interrogans serovar Canicola TaxID=211880 RepID=A0AAQ0B088_LEPIR|nr:hypothetical protein [Leptospira interrogans]MBE0302185.1 hypothetical protein [Leptospira interrogans serovar Yeoncheon]QOI45142.1 hypothetical protein Lepto782_23480 [Leptospira interrogans serovar Canicola]